MSHWHLCQAARRIRRGGLVAHATEGVWGLACDPWNPGAVAALLNLKGRRAAKGLIVIASHPEQLAAELDALDTATRRRVEDSWPGPVTWILPNREFPPWITGGRPTVAVRVPGHPQARALCRVVGGPLVSTSANPAGQPAARNRFQLRARLTAFARRRGGLGRAVHVLPGETLGRSGPSEIRTAEGRAVRGGS